MATSVRLPRPRRPASDGARRVSLALLVVAAVSALVAALLVVSAPRAASRDEELSTPVVLPLAADDAIWPLDPRPRVVRTFHPPATTWGPGHRGVDLLGHAGQAVRAARAGRISFASRLAGRGVVVVDHGRTRTTYEPVSASVHVGDRVGRGQTIGRLQRAHSHCAPQVCLHWGWLRGRTYLDPLLLVGGGPVRLLPLRGGPDSPAVARGAPAPAGPPSAPGPSRPVLAAARAAAEVGRSP